MTRAYETLIDPIRRKAYDRSYAAGTLRNDDAGSEPHFDAPPAGSRASATVVAVPMVTIPALFNRAKVSGAGRPNVKLKTGGAASITAS